MNWNYKNFYGRVINTSIGELMAHQLLSSAAKLHIEGKSPQEIADALGVSEIWVSMVMGADSFQILLRGEGDESAKCEG